MKVTKDTIIGDLLRERPQAVGTLMSYGMGCVMCPASQMESIQEAAMVHGLDADGLIEALNQQDAETN
ncbi:DUF1858 domain-containing protein [Peptoniphilus equinus]|uniref:DUF1858 domain-containing protein n=1 Tax=Peptoniphilus equinus TaxID=3016343 RepID=A0ABY7QT36_9FIRM|nr:DUF1858 domain-containing protein [Peptoniphilus equinus]WBW49956.1 DUF1858 domain-containing protein [Peptoniphilus equinus]